MSASDTPKSRLETRSFPPVSTPAPPPPPAAPLKPLKPLSNMSCCHLSGSCLGCNRRKRTHLLTSGSPCLCQSQSPHGWVLGQAGVPVPTGPGCSTPPKWVPHIPCPPHHYKLFFFWFTQRNMHMTNNLTINSKGMRCKSLYTHNAHIFQNNWGLAASVLTVDLPKTTKSKKKKIEQFTIPKPNQNLYTSPCTTCPPRLTTNIAHCFLAICASTKRSLQIRSSGTQGVAIWSSCLQRCTVFPGPPKSSLPSHERGFHEGKVSIRWGRSGSKKD